MKHFEPWHSTPIGRVIRFLGSIQLAVPVLVFVAGAMAWGTYLESTQSSKVSRALVYGSWWFIALMGLVCVSLIFAVIVRFPWRKRHVGFITVHAGLVMTIVGGFWSLHGRIEGHLTLEEGSAGDTIELDEEAIELTRFAAGKGTPVASVPAPTGPARLNLGAVQIEVVEHWANTAEEQVVTDGGPRPFRAVNMICNGAESWVGEEAKSGGATSLGGVTVRVLTEGLTWEPPAQPSTEPGGYFFNVGDKRYPLAAEGQEAFPGWRITAAKLFSHAIVSGSGLAEGDSTSDNPAIDVTISDGKGTLERHVAFMNFPDMVIAKTIEGSATSSAKLSATPSPTSAKEETVLVYGPGDAPMLGYIPRNGAARVIGPLGQLPASFSLGTNKLTFKQHFTRTQATTKYVQAPAATERRPAMVIKTAGQSDTLVIPWKGSEQLPGSADTLISYGPRTFPLPFSVKLADFRKLDYPGTEMAMSYESDVVISSPGNADQDFHIFMNNPYAQSPWKVYQSGFIGENVSVFSVMKDPGLPLTYIGCTVLCVGIFITFYSRSLSWGHPGIPIAFSQKETINASPAVRPAPRIADAPPPAAEPAHAGV